MFKQVVKKISSRHVYVVSLVVLLVLVGVFGRLLPHAWNATPVLAAAIFAGFLLGWRYAIIVPVITMLISDFFIGFDSLEMRATVYGSFILIGLLGLIIRKHQRFEAFLAGGVVGATLFFLITNAAVWFFTTMYPPTFEGLMLSYTMGLPFYKNMLIGDLFYVTAFYGVYRSALFLATEKSWLKLRQGFSLKAKN